MDHQVYTDAFHQRSPRPKPGSNQNDTLVSSRYCEPGARDSVDLKDRGRLEQLEWLAESASRESTTYQGEDGPGPGRDGVMAERTQEASEEGFAGDMRNYRQLHEEEYRGAQDGRLVGFGHEPAVDLAAGTNPRYGRYTQNVHEQEYAHPFIFNERSEANQMGQYQENVGPLIENATHLGKGVMFADLKNDVSKSGGEDRPVFEDYALADSSDIHRRI